MDRAPNVLFIFPDQWRADALSCLGHPVAMTPHVDNLAAEGTIFTNAHTNCPICIPARACLITGQTPDTVGRFGYVDRVSFEPYRTTLMSCLRDSGYQTMMAGKTHFYPRRIALGFERMRFADYGLDYENDYFRWLEAHTGGTVPPTLKALHGNSMITEPWTHDESLHNSNWTTQAALEMLETRDPTRPWFLNLAYHRPHPPFDPPVEYWDRFRDVDLPDPPIGAWAESRFDTPTWQTQPETGRMHPRQFDRMRRGYYASIAHVDAQIGRVLTWLQKREMFDDTLVIFSSDHGEQLGDHLQYRKSMPLRGSLGVPMVVKPPKSWDAPAGRTEDTPMALHDIMPTLLDAAGVPIPAEVEGCSFTPLVRGENAPDRDWVHGEMTWSPLGSWQCLVDRRSKYIWMTKTGEELLFDRINDPQEQHNLAEDPARQDELAQWRQRLAQVLEGRPENMSDGKKLIPGSTPPGVRPWLLNWKPQQNG